MGVDDEEKELVVTTSRWRVASIGKADQFLPHSSGNGVGREKETLFDINRAWGE